MTSESASEVLRHVEYGVYILTAADEERINGMPLSLFCQVSFSPLLVMAGVSPKRLSHSMIESSGGFGIIFLRKDQSELVDRFKLKGGDPGLKFGGLSWHKGRTGAPILDDCLGYLDCRLAGAYRPGDHTLFLGEVVHSEMKSQGSLLLISDLGKYYAG